MEVIEPTITLKLTGFLLGGLKLYIINKRKDTYELIYENKIEIIPDNLNRFPKTLPSGEVLGVLPWAGEKNNNFNQDLINSHTMKFNIPNIRANKRIGVLESILAFYKNVQNRDLDPN